MKRLILISLFSLLFSTACSSGQNSNPEDFPNVQIKNNVKPGVGKIMVIGDSLAYGYKATDESVRPINCLNQLPHAGSEDISIPGLTSQQILAKINLTNFNNVKLIFISSGGNDQVVNSNRPGSYPESQTLSEMSQAFDKLLATGAFVVYLGINPPPGSRRLTAISSLAVTKGVSVLDGMNGFWNNSTYMSSDNIHPNNYGYKVMCDRLLKLVSGNYP